MLLLALVLGSSLLGILYYLLLRFVEIRAPLLVLMLGLIASFYLVVFCTHSNPGTFSSSSTDHFATWFFALHLTICVCCGAWLHHPIQTSYGSLFNIFLVAAAIAASIITTSIAWDSLPYSHGVEFTAYFHLPLFYVAIFFNASAPVATAFLLRILRNIPLRPGVDKTIEAREHVTHVAE